MSEEQRIPTKDEIVAILKEQIEVTELQAKLAEAHARVAVARAKEYEALSFLGRSKNPQPTPPGDVHVITQEDLDNNPDLVTEGLKVGDQVIIPTQEQVIDSELKEAEAKKQSKRSLRKVD